MDRFNTPTNQQFQDQGRQYTIVILLGSTPTVGQFSPSQNVGVFLEDFVRNQLNQPPIPFEYFKDHDKQIPLLLDKTFAEQNITKDYIIYMEVQISPQKGAKKIKVISEIKIKDDESVEDKVKHFFKSTNFQYSRKVDVRQTQQIDAKNTCLSLNLEEGSIIYCQQLDNQHCTLNQTGSHFEPQTNNEKFKHLLQVDLPVDEELGKQKNIEDVQIIVNLQIEWNLQKPNLSILTIHSLIRALKSQLEKLSQSEILLTKGDSNQRCEKTSKLSDYYTQQTNQIVFNSYVHEIIPKQFNQRTSEKQSKSAQSYKISERSQFDDEYPIPRSIDQASSLNQSNIVELQQQFAQDTTRGRNQQQNPEPMSCFLIHQFPYPINKQDTIGKIQNYLLGLLNQPNQTISITTSTQAIYQCIDSENIYQLARNQTLDLFWTLEQQSSQIQVRSVVQPSQKIVSQMKQWDTSNIQNGSQRWFRENETIQGQTQINR